MDDATRILRVHLALAALGAAVVAFVAAALASALSFDTPPGAGGESHWQLVRSALTVGSAGTIALGSVSLAVVLAGAASLWRQTRRSRAVLRGLRRQGRYLDAEVIVDRRPLAFCAGLFRPRVFISTGTLEMLSREELDAVLAHERHHQRRRDPLRVFVVRALSDAMFVLPVLPSIARRYVAMIEVAADDAAVRAGGGDPAPLASALLAFDARADSAVVGIDPVRVDHLCGEAPRWQLPLALVAWSGLVLAGLAIAALRLTEASAELTLNMPLLARHFCLMAVDLGPLFAGAAALLFGHSALARRASVPEAAQ